MVCAFPEIASQHFLNMIDDRLAPVVEILLCRAERTISIIDSRNFSVALLNANRGPPLIGDRERGDALSVPPALTVCYLQGVQVTEGFVEEVCWQAQRLRENVELKNG